MKHPQPDIVLEATQETAGSLGRVGRRLRLAMEALQQFDGTGGPRHSHQRQGLLHDAADALWAYVIQKELIGITDNRIVNEVFGVTTEVWKLMGVIHPRPT